MNHNKNFSKALVALVFISFAILGFILGNFSFDKLTCLNNLKYINQRFICKNDFAISKSGYAIFQTSLEEDIDRWKSEGKISDIGFYFRDLENGPAFGINETKEFIPASLLKLPIAMTYFRLKDQSPNQDIFGQKIKYKVVDLQKTEFQQIFHPKDEIRQDDYYTVGDLIKFSLSESDNWATSALVDNLNNNFKGDDLILNTYKDLGIISSDDYREEDLTPRRYSSIFRLLYNVSYLSRESSDQVLSMIGGASFKDGLVAGVPNGIKVSHKFGERFGLPNGQKQLHDCGIVYYPKNPYLICVMTKGWDYKVLSGVIRDVSNMVYKEVDSRRLDIF